MSSSRIATRIFSPNASRDSVVVEWRTSFSSLFSRSGKDPGSEKRSSIRDSILEPIAPMRPLYITHMRSIDEMFGRDAAKGVICNPLPRRHQHRLRFIEEICSVYFYFVVKSWLCHR